MLELGRHGWELSSSECRPKRCISKVRSHVGREKGLDGLLSA